MSAPASAARSMVAREIAIDLIDTAAPQSDRGARALDLRDHLLTSDRRRKPAPLVEMRINAELACDVHVNGAMSARTRARSARAPMQSLGAVAVTAAAFCVEGDDPQPTSAYCGAQRSGSSIMRCASTGRMPT